MKKELMTNEKIKDYFEQEGVSLRNSSHLKIYDPDFNAITITSEGNRPVEKVDGRPAYYFTCGITDTFKDTVANIQIIYW